MLAQVWPCLIFFKLKITNVLKTRGWALEKSELPWELHFFIAIVVFPVELLAYQVSIVCTENCQGSSIYILNILH